MTVLDIRAKRNADKLRAVEADGASVRYHLRMRDGVVGIIDAFELFDGVSLMFNSIPRGTAEWDDREPCELQIDWCRRGRFELDAANGRAIRLNEGELAFHDERVLKRVMAFPSPLYTGLTLRIDRSVGAASLERALHGRTVDLDGLARRLTGEDGCTVCDPTPPCARSSGRSGTSTNGHLSRGCGSRPSNSSPSSTRRRASPRTPRATSEGAQSSRSSAA